MVRNKRKISRREFARTILLRGFVSAAFLGLIGRLYQLQILDGATYRRRAESNRSRVVDTPAPRGVIYDAQGKILARNRPSFQVDIVPADLPDDEKAAYAIVERLAALLGRRKEERERAGATERPMELLTLTEMWEKVYAGLYGAAFQPIPVARHVDRATAFILEEQSFAMPGVHLEVIPVREYPAGPLVSHLLGYTGSIPAERAAEYEARGYNIYQDRVGVAGLELTYEEMLRGEKGRKHVIVDFNGREVLVVGDPINPIPGKNLYLTLDLELQEAMTRALQGRMERAKAKSGVVIALNPKDGSILGMVSLPTYDNNLFSEQIPAEQYNALLNDPTLPLFNRAIAGLYPPGSTFKIIPASAALQEGVIGQYTTATCNGVLYLPNQFFPNNPEYAQPFVCWIRKLGRGHGTLSVVDALAVSCDIFFYTVGGGYRDFLGLGAERLAEYTSLFGFGAPTGIDLPGEQGGFVPTAKWKRLTYGEAWVTGDTYNMSIGQGYVLCTPLQILNATAAIANRGTLYKPHLFGYTTDANGHIDRVFEPQAIRELPIEKGYIDLVRQGMWKVVNSDIGTARIVRMPDVEVAGKTGTAEFYGPRDEQGNLPTHAWFTCFAPFDDPEIAMVVFVEGAGEGSTHAAPVAAEILRYYFDMKNRRLYGEPTPEPTAADGEATPEPTEGATE